MNKTIIDIQTDVKTAIDEIAPNDAEWVGEQDNTEANTIIDSKIEEAIDYVHLYANIGLMRGDVFVTVSCSETDNGVASVILSSRHLLRFVRAFAPDWRYPVTEAYEPTDAEYAMAKDAYVGGSANRPMVTRAQVFDGEPPSAGDLFKLYKTEDTAANCKLTYIPVSQLTGNGYAIDTNLYQAVIYRIAGLVMMTYGEERAKVLMDMSNTLMGIGGE